jgi:hypothetical protein
MQGRWSARGIGRISRPRVSLSPWWGKVAFNGIKKKYNPNPLNPEAKSSDRSSLRLPLEEGLRPEGEISNF